MADERLPLENEIRRLIAVAGPMPVADYMRLCLTHPQYGYYMNNDPLGAGGDFITSPEISQMFGELIGVWMAAVWEQMGSPENLRIVELGPGRGTLMLDVLRTTKGMNGFRAAIALHLVEISPALQRIQKRRLEAFDVPRLWSTTLDDVPDGPCIIIANEFMDALPVHQAIKLSDGWHERVVEVTADGNLTIGAARDPLPQFEATLPRPLRQCPEGSIYEWRSDRMALELARRVRSWGAALVIDYGHTHHGMGQTLQAVFRHSFTDPLRLPGRADLTAHVDFAALAHWAEIIGSRSHGPVSQREFLCRLGIEQRAAALKAHASAEQRAEIDAALDRLIGSGARAMGELFKALAIADPQFGPLPGFEG